MVLLQTEYETATLTMKTPKSHPKQNVTVIFIINSLIISTVVDTAFIIIGGYSSTMVSIIHYMYNQVPIAAGTWRR